MRICSFVLPLLFTAILCAESPREITFESADTRLKRAFGLAKETNDESTIEKVLQYRDGVKRALTRKDVVAAERLVRDAEAIVGLEDGGESMLGLKVALLDATRRKTLDALEPRIVQAMNGNDLAAVQAVMADCLKLMGENAGVPEVRRKGDKTKPLAVKPKDVAELYLKVIQVDPRSLKALSSGKPVGDTLPRGYAAVIDGCLTIRPLVQEHFPNQLDVLDKLIGGCCSTLVSLQTKGGFFKFPDVRGRNNWLGEMIDKIVDQVPDAIEGEWLVVADPAGGSQIDSGECGMALLRAGTIFKNDAWKQAGLKAAEWASASPLAANFHWNAFTVSLLCEAFRATGEKKFLDTALKKHEFGISHAQSPTGRWADPLNARTGNHVVILRSLHDLIDVMTVSEKRAAIEKSAKLAMNAIVDEAETLGSPITSNTVHEFERHMRLVKEASPKARGLLESSASGAIQRCSSGGKIRPGAPLPELAAAAFVWK